MMFTGISRATGLLLACFTLPSLLHAQEDAVCARVKLEIAQEATLERQAFKANMKVRNNLEGVSLENVQVTLAFTTLDGETATITSDPNQLDAHFFSRLDHGSLPGTVAGGTSLDLEWLLIPTRIAGGEDPEGTLYFAGAELRYTVQGKEEIVRVEPDAISVLPIPDLILDYFLPVDVYADNPFTLQQEPIVPFSLGLRVSNIGFGPARQLKIESAQPEIVENELELLIDFRLLGAAVGNQEVEPSLTVDFGDLAPGGIATARWVMTTTLSGQFTEFDAEFSHADELGGATTSLISQVETHALLQEVRDDSSGRDDLLDFLARELPDLPGVEEPVFLYSSEEIGTEQNRVAVTDQSLLSSLTLNAGAYRLDTVPSASPFFVYLPDPNRGELAIRSVVRSDGKRLPVENVWLSQVWNKQTTAFDHFVNLFDLSNSGQSYRIEFGVAEESRRIELIAPTRSLLPSGDLFQVPISTTTNSTLPVAISSSTLPLGATLTDQGQGEALISWTPSAAQIGSYSIRLYAATGTLVTSEVIQLDVIDGDRFASWQEQFWPGETDPAIIGANADPIGDGIPNLLHYVFDQDPTQPHLPAMELGVVEQGGLRYMTLTYLRRTDDPNLKVEVVAADRENASTWTPVPNETAVAQNGVPPGLERIQVIDSVPLENVAQRRLLRLRALLP